MMKRFEMILVMLVFVPVVAFGATIYPSDGDAWTEDSTSGWAGTAAVFALDATEVKVGTYSITTGEMVKSYPNITLTLSEAVDVSNSNASITFWLRINCTDALWNPQIRIGSGDIINDNLTYNFGSLVGDFAWQELTVNLSDMSEKGTAFDPSSVTQIMFMANAVTTVQTTEFFVDGLHFTVPEPATMTLLVFGSLAGFFRKKK